MVLEERNRKGQTLIILSILSQQIKKENSLVTSQMEHIIRMTIQVRFYSFSFYQIFTKKRELGQTHLRMLLLSMKEL